jgi:hypothetical protein
VWQDRARRAGVYAEKGKRRKEIPEAWIWVESNLGASFPLGDVRPFFETLLIAQGLNGCNWQ